jgi:hypothetical protein
MYMGASAAAIQGDRFGLESKQNGLLIGIKLSAASSSAINPRGDHATKTREPPIPPELSMQH